MKSVKKVITHLEMIGTFGTVYWRQFFLSKKLFIIFSIIVNSFCAVLATRALFRVLKQRNNILEFKAYW